MGNHLYLVPRLVAIGVLDGVIDDFDHAQLHSIDLDRR